LRIRKYPIRPQSAAFDQAELLQLLGDARKVFERKSIRLKKLIARPKQDADMFNQNPSG